MNNKNKKTVIFILIIIFVIIAINFVGKGISSDEDKLDVIIKNTEETVNNAQLNDKPTESKISGNYSGTILFENRSEFLEKVSEDNINDNAILLANTLSSGNLDYLNIVLEDADDKILEEYFNLNKETIFTLWGISDIETFRELYSLIKPLSHINKVTLDIDSLVIENNTFNYLVYLNNGDVSLEFKSIVKENSVSDFWLGGK